jgi:PTS system mannose-specific IIA component
VSVGLLLITHNDVGATLVRTATRMLASTPLAIATLGVRDDSDPEVLVAESRRLVARLDQGDGVLVLTDIYGSTPGNIATRLRQAGRVSVVAGVNLPMLVRALNYPGLDLEGLTGKALSGGRDGVMACLPH